MGRCQGDGHISVLPAQQQGSTCNFILETGLNTPTAPSQRNLSHTDIPMSPHAFRYQVFLVSVLGFIEFTPIPPLTVATFAQMLSSRCHLEYYSSPLTGLSAHLAPIHSSSMSPGLHSIFILYLNPSASLRDLEDYVPIS